MKIRRGVFVCICLFVDVHGPAPCSAIVDVLSVTLCGMGWMKEGGLLQRFWNNMAGRESSRTPEACVKGIAELALSETELKAIAQPVTVIIGSDDPVKRLYVKPLQAARPDGPFIEISGGGHLTTIKMPEFHTALTKSLSEKSK